MTKLKIAAIGPIPRDNITTHKGKVIEKYGCITHPVVVLSKLAGENAEIYPVSHILQSDAIAIHEILDPLPGVNCQYINAEVNRGDVISLRFLDQNERIKTMSAFMDPIVVDDIKNLLDCDAFLCLPVTDFEIALETVKFIKNHSNGLIIFDAHGATKTVSSLGDRLFKFWVDRDQWLPYIDILKMNLREAKCCWYKKRYTLEELEEDEPLNLNELPNFARHCLKMGVKALYVTLDARGCLVYFMENNKLREEMVPAATINNIVDSTGCGDSFAGGLTYGLLTTDNDYLHSAYYANALGAQCLQAANFEGFLSLEETESTIKLIYKNHVQQD